MEWISVKDRLPDIGSYVLIYDPEGQFNPSKISIGQYTKHGFTSVYRPTYWMPLPEPPKTEE